MEYQIITNLSKNSQQNNSVTNDWENIYISRWKTKKYW